VLLLTTDWCQLLGLLPLGIVEEMLLNVKVVCSSNQVLEYMNGHKESMKSIKGWLYSSDLAECREIC
jgi:hypothetical protein